MRTNIVLEDNLMKEAFRCSSAKTKKELVHAALQEYVRNHGRLDLFDLRGKIAFSHGYDHKKMRRGETM
jgi:Arc/MetJ family transcription regulator